MHSPGVLRPKKDCFDGCEPPQCCQEPGHVRWILRKDPQNRSNPKKISFFENLQLKCFFAILRHPERPLGLGHVSLTLPQHFLRSGGAGYRWNY